MVARARVPLTSFPGVVLACCLVERGLRDRTSPRNWYRTVALDFCET